MQSVGQRFHLELNDLERLIEYYNIESKIPTLTPSSNEPLIDNLVLKYKSFESTKRKINYNSIIISLYGYFERFIEDMVSSYISSLTSVIGSYDKLPSKIIENNYKLSLTLLPKTEQPRYSGILRKETIIENLHNCFTKTSGYTLNTEAFTQHTANFKYDVINYLFLNAGISEINDLIKNDKKVHKFMCDYWGLDGTNDLTAEQTFFLLNDLAARRNEVAHGIQGIMLQTSEFLPYIQFFRVYNNALLYITSQNFLNYNIENNAKPLGVITSVYSSKNVLCFYTNKIPLKNGDVIYGMNKHEIMVGKIQAIKFNDTDIDKIDGDENYEIGVKLDVTFKKSHKLYKI